MDSTSNKITTTYNQEQAPSSSLFNHPFPPYDHLHTLNPTTTADEPPPSTQAHPPPPPPPPAARTSKKRTRASRRAPTTVLTTDTSNFRSLVQQFTGFPPPPPPSSSSSFPYLLPLRPTPSSLLDSIAAINAAVNGHLTLETVISSSGSDTAALASYPFVNANTDLAPQLGDLGGPSGALSGWAECGDQQLNICCELVKPPCKRQTVRGADGVAIESWSGSSSD